MAEADKDVITDTIFNAITKMLPLAEKPTRAEVAAKIDRARLDAQHRRTQETNILRAAVGFTSAVSVVCVVTLFSPWSSDTIRTWATSTLTAVATSFGGFWAGKQSTK